MSGFGSPGWTPGGAEVDDRGGVYSGTGWDPRTGQSPAQATAQSMQGLTEEQMAADLQARQAAAPTGITDVDPQVLLAAIAQLQQQMAALQAEKGASGKPPLLSVTDALTEFVGHLYADTPGHQLALDMADAAANAVQSGDGLAVEKLGVKLEKWLTRHAPAPGENYHYRQALDLVRHHLADQLEVLQPPVKPLTPVSGGAPARVVPGSVTAG